MNWNDVKRELRLLAVSPEADPTALDHVDRIQDVLKQCEKVEREGAKPYRILPEGPAVVLRDGRTVASFRSSKNLALAG